MKFRPLPTPFRMPLGNQGEALACDYLLKKKYKILEKNYRCTIGEIDIIAEAGGRLLFIEVKTRRSDRFGTAAEAVTPAKQKKLILLAEWYRKEKKRSDYPAGFEVVTVDYRGGQPVIRHIENAFNAESEK